MKKHILIALAVMVMACKKEETATPTPSQPAPIPVDTTPVYRLITIQQNEALQINNEMPTYQMNITRMFKKGETINLIVSGSINTPKYLRVYQDTLVININTTHHTIKASYTVK